MRRSNSRRWVKKATTTSADPRALALHVDTGRKAIDHPGGAPMRASVEPSVIPSFFGSGVPLYPATDLG